MLARSSSFFEFHTATNFIAEVCRGMGEGQTEWDAQQQYSTVVLVSVKSGQELFCQDLTEACQLARCLTGSFSLVMQGLCFATLTDTHILSDHLAALVAFTCPHLICLIFHFEKHFGAVFI